LKNIEEHQIDELVKILKSAFSQIENREKDWMKAFLKDNGRKGLFSSRENDMKLTRRTQSGKIFFF